MGCYGNFLTHGYSPKYGKIDLMTSSLPEKPSTVATGDAAWVQVDSAGRLVVPAKYRAALGFRSRQRVLLTLESDGLTLKTPGAALDAAIERAQTLARKYGGGRGGEVDAFLAERRAEAARD